MINKHIPNCASILYSLYKNKKLSYTMLQIYEWLICPEVLFFMQEEEEWLLEVYCHTHT